MSRTLSVVACVLLTLSTVASSAETELGSCEANAQRAKRTFRYNVESLSESDAEVRAKPFCADDVVTIKRCAVINIQHKKIQRYCFPKDRPAYYEYVDVIEYWGTPANQ